MRGGRGKSKKKKGKQRLEERKIKEAVYCVANSACSTVGLYSWTSKSVLS